LRKAMVPVMDESFKKALEDEKDKDKRDAAEKAYKAFAPTLKSGELDLGVNFRGPSSKGMYAMVAAIKVKDGAEIEKVLRESVKSLKLTFNAKAQLVTFFSLMADPPK